jgi:hypothetical protein
MPSQASLKHLVLRGALADIRKISPIAHIWTKSAQPWIPRFINNDICHETEPDRFDDLVAQFQK